MSSLIAPSNLVEESLKSKNELANKWALARQPRLAFLQPIANSFKAYCCIYSEEGSNISYVSFQSFQDSLWDHIDGLIETKKSNSHLIYWIYDALQANLLQDNDTEILEEISKSKIKYNDPNLTIEFLIGRDQISKKVTQRFNADLIDPAFSWLLSDKSPETFSEESDIHVPSGKRLRVEPVVFQALDFQGPITWLICANTLFEHLKYKHLKKLALSPRGMHNDDDDEMGRTSNNLITNMLYNLSNDKHEITPIDLIRWIWTKFMRCKFKFDSLTYEEFSIFNMTDEECSSEGINYYEISRCYFQIEFLHRYASYLAVDLSQSLKDSDISQKWINDVSHRCRAMLPCITAFKEYANVICFFIKAGHLSDKCLSLKDICLNSNDFILPRYNYDTLSRFLTNRQPLRLTQRIFDMIFEDKSDEIESVKVWKMHEELLPNETPTYPPKKIQSICALFQLTSVHEGARFALLVYFLLDTIGAYCHELFKQQDICNDSQKEELCSKIQNQYLGLLRDRFPCPYYKFMDAILISWLVDRHLFKYLLCNTEIVNADFLNDFVNKSNNSLFLHSTSAIEQANYLKAICLEYDQDELSPKFHKRQTFQNPTITPKPCYLDDANHSLRISGPIGIMMNFKKVRTLRHSMSQIEWKRTCESIFELVLKKGHLRQLISQGLHLDEATVLLEYIRKYHYYADLFNVFISRSSFKEALIIHREASLVTKLDSSTNYSSVMELFSETNKRLVNSLDRRIGHLTHYKLLPNALCINLKQSSYHSFNINSPISSKRSGIAEEVVVEEKKVRRLTNKLHHIQQSNSHSSASPNLLNIGQKRDRTPERLTHDELKSQSVQKSLIKSIFTPPRRNSKTLNRSFHIPGANRTPVSIMKGKSENRTPRRLTFSLLEDGPSTPIQPDKSFSTILKSAIKRKPSLLVENEINSHVPDECQLTKGSPKQEDFVNTDGNDENKSADSSTSFAHSPFIVDEEEIFIPGKQTPTIEEPIPICNNDKIIINNSKAIEKKDYYYFEQSVSTTPVIDSETASHNTSFEDNNLDDLVNPNSNEQGEEDDKTPEPAQQELCGELSLLKSDNILAVETVKYETTLVVESIDQIKDIQEKTPEKEEEILTDSQEEIQAIVTEHTEVSLKSKNQERIKTTKVSDKPQTPVKAAKVDEKTRTPKKAPSSSTSTSQPIKNADNNNKEKGVKVDSQEILKTPKKKAKTLERNKSVDEATDAKPPIPVENDKSRVDEMTPRKKITRSKNVSTSSGKPDADSLIDSISRKQKLRSANKTALEFGLPRLSYFDKKEGLKKKEKTSESAQPSLAGSMDDSASSTTSLTSRGRGRPKRMLTPSPDKKGKRARDDSSPELETTSAQPVRKRASIRLSDTPQTTPRRSTRLSRVHEIPRDLSPTLAKFNETINENSESSAETPRKFSRPKRNISRK